MKKEIRFLSLLLAVLMITTMANIVTIADYQYDETATNESYYTDIDYDSLVGKENQGKKGVYIIDVDWQYAQGEEPEKVSFYYRGNTIEEYYDPNRHLATVADMYAMAEMDNIELPYCILTSGNYSETIKLTDSVILLGANAGINPNVPHSDPTKKWELNSDRYLPEMTSWDFGNETRIWAGGDLCQTEREAGNTLKLFQITKTEDAAKTYVIDGLLFQGYGASFCDTNAGSGSRTYYLQNVIMNDNSAYDVSPIRLWGRSAGDTTKKQMHFSNSYVYGNDSMYFYSGHANKLYINGVSYQESTQDFIYNGMTKQWIGMDFAMTNCHLWNSENLATTGLVDSHYIARFPYTSPSYAYAGNNTEPFHYNISNNTFCNMTAVDNYGDLKSTTAPFQFYMASEDEMVKFEDNIFISTMSIGADQARSPIQIRYNCLADGTISRGSTEKVSYTSTTDAYALNEKNVSIKNNIFSKEYCKPINIGTNTTPGTLIENEGNLYTEEYDGENIMTGMILANDSKTNYDKWVWLEYDPKGANTDPTKKSNYIDVNSILIDEEAKEQDITVELPSDIQWYQFSVSCNNTIHSILKKPINTVKVYEANENFIKGAEVSSLDWAIGEFVLSTANYHNYYIISILSIDERSSYDYYMILNRNLEDGNVFAYTIENGEVTITSYNKEVEGKLEIPSVIEGYPVTTIGSDAFYMCNSLTAVTLPDSTTTIGTRAFKNCDGLTSVTIPNSVKNIGQNAFDTSDSAVDATLIVHEDTSGHSYVMENTNPYELINHAYKCGICMECGYVNKEFGMDYVIMLLKHIDGLDVGLTDEEVDISGDGKVTVFDAVRFLQLMNTTPMK